MMCDNVQNVKVLIGIKNMKKTITKQREVFKKKLLKRETISEIKLSNFFNSNEVSFKKQFILPPYILDFYFPKKGVAIELDGGFHKTRITEDDKRDNYISSIGIVVLRYPNSEKPEKILADINLFKELDEKSYSIIRGRINRIRLVSSQIGYNGNIFSFDNIYHWKQIHTQFKIQLRKSFKGKYSPTKKAITNEMVLFSAQPELSRV